MSNEVKVKLKYTNNPKFAYLIGKEGTLSVENDGRFYFNFLENGELRHLSSNIVSQLGSINHPASRELNFKTKNSEYDFEKLERSIGLFSYEKNEMDLGDTISYEEYSVLRNSIYNFRNGDNMKLTLAEQSSLLRKWNNVNQAIKDNKMVILPPSIDKKIDVAKNSLTDSMPDRQTKSRSNEMGLSL